MKKILKLLSIVIMLTVATIYTMPTKVMAFGPSSDEIYNGIDVSGYQGNIDFGKVKKDGIQVVYIRSSEGTNYIDSKFEQNYKRARDAGLKIGFYHYVLYSNAYTASRIWEGEVTNYPLWIAQYEVNKPENSGTWKSWAGWQYTDVGRVSGISNNVDRDKFTKEIFMSEGTQIPDTEKPKPDEEDDKTTTKKIKIKWGDTLSQLAIKYNTTVAELVRLNNIQNPNLIYAGNYLIVPVKGENTSNTTIYTVKSGDTLSEIAQMFNTTVSKIAQENNIQNVNLIYPRPKASCK